MSTMQLVRKSHEDVMKYLGMVLVVFISAGAFFAPGLAQADLGPLLMLRGGVVAPKAPHQSIRLESQDVTIRLGKTGYLVNAVFHFRNTGQTGTEWVGFPKKRVNEGYSNGDSDFLRFDTWVDGMKTAVKQERDLSAAEDRSPGLRRDNSWMVHHVTFPGHGNTTIRCVYEAAYDFGFKTKAMSYLYGTGAFWKGRVGSAVFTIDATDVGGTKNIFVEFRSAPSVRRLGANALRYEIHDFEPRPEAQVDVLIKIDSRVSVTGAERRISP
ncbi:MAG: hypothetical protein V1792_24500 [Pseudomonadota bacterium]